MTIHELIPYTALIARPLVLAAIHHYGHGRLHHLLEHGLHHATHKIHFLHKLSCRIPWLCDRIIDTVLVCGILVFGAVTEGHENGHEHTGE